MTTLYRRKAVVRVGTLEIETTVADSGVVGLDVSFSVERTLRHEPNTCELQIFNLTADRRAELQQLRSAGVTIEAGYEQNVSVIFAGDLREARTVRDGPDLVTEIEAGDGEKAHRTARVNTSAPQNGSIVDTIRSVTDSFGIQRGNVDSALTVVGLETGGSQTSTRQFRGGAVVSGRSSTELSRLLDSVGYEYSIQNGVFQVLPRGQTISQDALLLTPETGLLGSPTRSSDGILSATSLIIPDLFPGRKVRFESPETEGFFRVETAKYTGDTSNQEWFIEMECKEV